MAKASQDSAEALKAHLAQISNLLPLATPLSAYALGIITAEGLRTGKFPSLRTMRLVAEGQNAVRAVELAMIHRDLRQGRGGRA
jgi:hypothetical protein